MNSLRVLLTLCSLVFCFTPIPATAQVQRDPPYESELLRLAELLGSMHFLRPLCGAEEGDKWLKEMEAFIAAEKPTPERRARLIERFNRGYRTYATNYNRCTEAARLAAGRHAEEGARIARELNTRYGR